MIFSKILKFADQHVKNMKADNSINQKKTAIAKFSFLSGFQLASMMYDQDNNATIHREEKREENTHQPEQLPKLALSNIEPDKESLPGNSTS
jgi:hypothetical protein